METGDAGEDRPATGAAPQARQRGRLVLLAVPFVVLAVLATLIAVLVVRAHDRSARDAARRGALQVAREEAINLTTLSYTSASHDLDRILSLATGQLQQRFAAERSKFPNVLGQQKSESRGNVLSAGLVRLAPGLDAAEVAVATDASVTMASGQARSAPTVKHYRMVMQLRLVDGHWRVSDVAFAGVPQ